MAGSILVLVGTTKGLFILRKTGGVWQQTGPHCHGWPINHALAVGDTLLACGGNEWFGAGIWRSTDGGESWEVVKLADGQMDEWVRNDPETAAMLGVKPCAEVAPFSGRVQAMWSLGRAGDTLYAGAKPATLFSSGDDGVSWQAVESLTDHPSADSWQPGAVGLTLHTIVAAPGDPSKLWLGISAAGVFATEDGGASWERRNRLSNAEACQHHHPAGPRDGDTGHCLHNMVRAPGSEDVLYQQNHCGVFRSRDGGRSWDDITAGLPSTFGFPVAVHPTKPDTLWTLPLNGDTQGRYPPEASAAVWRSRDGGDTWEACRDGLPQEHCFFTVLRQGMTVDPEGGVYFGTNSGSVFATADEGDSWQELAQHLPTVLCVEAAR
ncbi:WD40/YVTN/BNR-like repeat-containing protein [Sagittula sp. S175]|uniref:WD40/YVTN/BNR-like repeat-containing protein n=1 Tax=Sagittula sp. S175 TaxID=3415129 RepID=UPI003C7C7FEB